MAQPQVKVPVPAKPRLWVTDEAFSLTLGASIQSFEAGIVIRDPGLAERLIAAKAPIHEAEAEDVVVCPHCGSAFTPE